MQSKQVVSSCLAHLQATVTRVFLPERGRTSTCDAGCARGVYGACASAFPQRVRNARPLYRAGGLPRCCSKSLRMARQLSGSGAGDWDVFAHPEPAHAVVPGLPSREERWACNWLMETITAARNEPMLTGGAARSR
jgi:hypothetical protein